MNKIILWLRNNLFSTWYDTIFTVAILYLLYIIIPPSVTWLLFDANFLGTGPESCTSGGACWVFVKMRLNQFLFGYYPRDLQWRITLSYIIGIIFLIYFLRAAKHQKNLRAILLFIGFPIIAFILYHGGIFGLEEVDTYSWGGLHLTLVIGLASIILSIPLGILLALARQSKLPVVNVVSATFIELWRGVPLVSILFMASFLIPIFFTTGLHIDKVLRALVGITLFSSAYMAEIIRGGLDNLPKGQYEAAKALGFKYFNGLYFIILPQVLSEVIPGLVNIVVRIFKDTTLVSIIGLFDFLGMVQAANEDPKWLAYGLEGYIFAAFAFWVFCYLMTRYSKHLTELHRARQRR